MLSSNSTLQNGRFRVIGLFGEADGGRLYDAFDNQLGQRLVIHESSADDNFAERLAALKHRRIKGIVQIRDGFVEGPEAYFVTEELVGRASADTFINDPANSIGMLLSGLQALLLDGVSPASVDVHPQMVRQTADGNNCFLSFSTGSSPSEQRGIPKLTPFAALETVWPGLDLVTQKAISNAFSEDDVAAIESPADDRTLVYSLGSSVYQIIAGKSPLDVLVRSIELLDEKGDPLKKLAELRPSISTEMSETISSMMAPMRKDRTSLSESSTKLANILPKQASEAFELDLDDDLDLLEIPLENEPVRPSIVPLPPEPMLISRPEPSSQPDPILVEPKVVPTEVSVEPTAPEMEVEEEIGQTLNEEIEEIAERPAEPFKPSVPAFEPVRFAFEEKEAEVPAFAMEETPNSSGIGLKVIAAAAGLVVVAIVGWFLLANSGGTNASASTAPTEPRSEPAVVAPETPAATNNISNEPAALRSEPMAPSSNDLQPIVDETKQLRRPVVAEVKPQAKPSPTKVEKPKKTVTVDDLIKDN